tara:strand:+ start:78 stop:182 length:105 start_codon:yes stop_codon:yes gene_type:complete
VFFDKAFNNVFCCWEHEDKEEEDKEEEDKEEEGL